MGTMKVSPLPPLISVLCLFPPAVFSSDCYNPDGSLVTNPSFVPCSQEVGTFSTCCGTNWTGSVGMPDICEANGLCLNSYDNAPLYFRGSCSDPTWESPVCLANLCTNNGDPIENVAVSQCPDGTWCCDGGTNTACCAEKAGVVLLATVGDTISTASSSSSSASANPGPASHTSISTASTRIPTPIQSSQSNTSTPTPTQGPQSEGQAALIGVGGVAASIILIAGLITWCIVLRRCLVLRQTTLDKLELEIDQKGATSQTYVAIYHELATTRPESFRHELAGPPRPPVEMEAREYGDWCY